MNVSELLGWALAKALRAWTSPQTLGNLACLLLLLILVPRWRTDAPRGYAVYGSRRFRTDLIYTAFYVGAFYAFFVASPVYFLLRTLVGRYAPFLETNLLANWHPAAQFVAVFVAMDGIVYWTHRWFHRSPTLWAFHAIHHSQQELTPLSNFRFHFGDVLVRTTLQFVPGLVLGAPAAVWLPSIWIQLSLEALAHADLDWGYGPLGRVIVSPRYHRVHHAADADRHGSNFGISFSFWDVWFGTRARSEVRPRAYGIEGVAVPESFLRQLAFPFLALWRRTLAPPAGRRAA